MIEFRRELIKDIRSDIEDNFIHHRVDILDYTTADLDVNWDLYVGLEEMNRLCIVTARDDGKFIGYLAFILDRHFHHNTIQATTHVTYVHPAYRRNGVAGDMFKAAEGILKDLGVFLVACFVLPAKDYSPMLLKQGFELAERIYTKKL